MTVRTLITLAMLTLPAFVQGCGSPDCAALCKEMDGCPDAARMAWKLTPMSVRAPQLHPSVRNRRPERKGRLRGSVHELWKCVDNREDICQAQYGCQMRWDLYADCLAGYCVNKAGDSDCAKAGF
jgi:hypothetical protein